MGAPDRHAANAAGYGAPVSVRRFDPYSVLGHTAAQAALPRLYEESHHLPWSVRLRELIRSCTRHSPERPHRPIDAESGAFLNQMVRILDARLTLLLGTSAGLTAIWLASALRDGGRRSGDRGLIAWESSAEQAQTAHRHLRAANLSRYVDLHHGEGHAAFQRVDEPVDLIVIDSHPESALPVLKPLLPKLRSAGVIVACGLHRHKKQYADYLRYVRNRANGYASICLCSRAGIEVSIKT